MSNNAAFLSGFFEVPGRLTPEGAARLSNAWKQMYEGATNGGKPAVMVLEEGIKFVPLQTNTVPDAICRYCTVANLSSAAWCTQCGAPMIR